MSGFRRVHALVLRYVLLVGRDPSRVVDLVIWPFIAVGVVAGWGFIVWMYYLFTGPPGPV